MNGIGLAMSVKSLAFVLLTLLLLSAGAAIASDNEVNESRYKAPRWSLELKGGRFEPDLELYETFYGSDKSTYWAVDAAYRFASWVELGAELGYSNDKGQGFLPNNGQLGGQVEYTLVPLTVYVNLRYDRSPDQLFVPYIGAGLVTAWYRQRIDSQSDREGRTDVGAAARAGVQLLLNRIDQRGAASLNGSRRFKAFLFLEAQTFTAEIDDIDLGGDVYLLGLRFEFD